MAFLELRIRWQRVFVEDDRIQDNLESGMQDFRDLSVWQQAHALTLNIYRITRPFPPEERFGLTSQMRRASASIAANLAEGTGRATDADFARFVVHAIGWASELDYHVLLAEDLRYLLPEDGAALADDMARIKRMLNGLLKALGR